MPVRAHNEQLAVRREHGDEILEPPLLLFTDRGAFAVVDVAQIVDDDQIVVRGDEIAERADGRDAGLAVIACARAEHDRLRFRCERIERRDIERAVIERDELLVTEIMPNDLIQEGLCVFRGGVHEQYPEIRIPEQPPDRIGLGEERGLVGVAGLEPERARMPVIELACPVEMWVPLQPHVPEYRAREVVEVVAYNLLAIAIVEFELSPFAGASHAITLYLGYNGRTRCQDGREEEKEEAWNQRSREFASRSSLSVRFRRRFHRRSLQRVTSFFSWAVRVIVSTPARIGISQP